MIAKRYYYRLLLCLSATFVALIHLARAAEASVQMWEEDIVIPTYLTGPPEPNPMFYFGRSSQGAEGRIYPYPLYDKLTGQKEDKTYKIVYLENEYIRIGILPEIGGRVFEGVDKTNGYNFFYRQHVIKPALIGLIGAWISGGIEWNIPHHHRASTFIPVQYRMEENDDGSKTVWVGELELRHRMRWAVGYTLRPGKSYLEASIRILNRTPLVNTFLCFANVAVHVNENYQVIFPPGTQHVTFHSKRQFTTWPIATTRFAGGDFREGVDVSWYRNHISSNSMFVWNYEDDFFAGYDHGQEAGTMSFANHHIVPGKKLWTWGNGPNGRMWDQILTDDDGPYMELMVGAYSDNQPDYSWLQPYEVKSFKEYWYPFRDIGGVKKANLDAAVNLDVADDGAATVGFCTTSVHPDATITLRAGDTTLLEQNIAIDPARPFIKQVSLPAGIDLYELRASISDEGKEILAYSPIRLEPEPMPEPVSSPLPPSEIKTNRELYLTGLRIDQFHNPDLEPDPYWEEALSRDPGDARVNTALGIVYLKRARFADAERHFRKALERLTDNYTSPRNGEPFYYLGVALKVQERNDEAFDAFYKATWSAAWRAASYFSLAEIACLRGNLTDALELVENSIEANALNIRALNLKAALLRHTGHQEEALKVLALAHSKTDPLDVRSLIEHWLATQSSEDREALLPTLKKHPATGLETAVEYRNAGLWEDGASVLRQMVESGSDPSKISPMVYYYLGYFLEKLGQGEKAAEAYRLANRMPPDYVFPFQFEAIPMLRRAMEVNPDDARAPYYLGNLLFDGQHETAIKLWEQSVSLDDSFPIAHRNLAIAWSHEETGNSLDKAIASLEKAVSLGGRYPLHFFELDQLYEAVGRPPEERLAMLEKHHDTVLQRDDALAREIGLKVFMGKYDEAIELMQGRQFSIWEGSGRFSVGDYWTDAHLLRGRQRLASGKYQMAIDDFQKSIVFPENLRASGSRGGERDSEVDYWVGTAYEDMGEPDQAKQHWKNAVSNEPSQYRRRRGNFLSNQSAQRFYQALALRKLGRETDAEEIFKELVESGTEALQRTSPEIDSSTKFDEQSSQRTRLAMAHYVAGLGYLGLNEREKADRELTEALQVRPDHLGAKTAKFLIN